jgi:hypothetical protein
MHYEVLTGHFEVYNVYMNKGHEQDGFALIVLLICIGALSGMVIVLTLMEVFGW